MMPGRAMQSAKNKYIIHSDNLNYCMVTMGNVK